LKLKLHQQEAQQLRRQREEVHQQHQQEQHQKQEVAKPKKVVRLQEQANFNLI
jgi:hypothetical protein